MMWLVTWSYFSERASVAVVEAASETHARERAAEVAGADKWEYRAIHEEAECHQIVDGLVVLVDAPY
jgi:hypothetical protein